MCCSSTVSPLLSGQKLSFPQVNSTGLPCRLFMRSCCNTTSAILLSVCSCLTCQVGLFDSSDKDPLLILFGPREDYDWRKKNILPPTQKKVEFEFFCIWNKQFLGKSIRTPNFNRKIWLKIFSQILKSLAKKTN